MMLDNPIKLKNEAAWSEGLKNNGTEGYGLTVYYFALLWAQAMQEAMHGGAQLETIAEETCRRLDNDLGCYGLSGFQYGAVVAVLAECWEHGDELRRWHNLKTQIGNEGVKANESGATLNPALLRIE